jgi:uncharacterized protein
LQNKEKEKIIIYNNMWNNWGFRVMLFVVLAFIFFYTFNSKNTAEKPPSLEYSSRLAQERVAKDKFFKENKDSPIENKKVFENLPYFKIDEAYKVEAKLELDKTGLKIPIQTTDNKADTLVKYAVANFSIKGTACSFVIYKSTNERLLFLPFRDKTSGLTTYGGGRYLDIPLSDIIGNKAVIDFNLAYHPYCAYNHTYICPIPPKENTLTIAVEAGEKL